MPRALHAGPDRPRLSKGAKSGVAKRQRSFGPTANPTEAYHPMKRFLQSITRFLADEHGPTAVEYAMLMLLVFLACLTAVTMMGQSTVASFQDSSASMHSAFESRP